MKALFLEAEYLAQLRFSLSSSSVFCRSDTSTDLERFYESVFDFLNDPDEKEDVADLMNWWNWWLFSIYTSQAFCL